MLLLLAALFLETCANTPTTVEDIPLSPRQTPSPESFEILTAESGDVSMLPEWVAAYLDGGSAALEALDEYADRYVFVAAETNANLRLLEQWAGGFSLAEDTAQLVFRRVRERFFSLAANPDSVFGNYYEQALKKVLDARFVDARQDGNFWLQMRFLDEASAEGTTSYRYLILISVDRRLFQRQLDQLFAEAEAAVQPGGAQAQAIQHTHASFYDQF